MADKQRKIEDLVGESDGESPSFADEMRQGQMAILQAIQALAQGIQQVAQIAAADRESEVVRDPKTGRVAGGRSRLVMPTMQ